MTPSLYGPMRWLVRMIARTYLGRLYRVQGAGVVPRSGPLIVCPNHFGTLDPAIVPSALPRSDSWSMAKAEWFGHGRAMTWLFESYHAFPVIRHSPDRRALRRAFQILDEGGCLILFPEGTRIDSGGLAEPEPGAGYIAQRSQAPVVPVAITGSREVLPRGATVPRRLPLTVTFGAPIRVRDQRVNGGRVSAQEAAAAIMLGVAELLPPDQRGVFSDLQELHDWLRGAYEPAW